jgi:hypothetical protein
MLYRNSITIKSHNATIQWHIHVHAILCKSCACCWLHSNMKSMGRGAVMFYQYVNISPLHESSWCHQFLKAWSLQNHWQITIHSASKQSECRNTFPNICFHTSISSMACTWRIIYFKFLTYKFRHGLYMSKYVIYWHVKGNYLGFGLIIGFMKKRT